MNNMSANQEEIDMMLTQMGADVTSLHGIISFIRFNLDQTELFYVYNINAKNQYFLQMVKPYPAAAGVFSKSKAVVQYIKNDIRQFRNASNSNVFQEFIAVNQNLYDSIQSIKDVFMTYNVPKDKMLEIKEKAGEISAVLDEIKSTSSVL
ncbi:hypothetical protein CAFE_34570 [Caprobacter fermentans]|uniref:Uncharacterized protein n=1 Tax=Caproicibacter fermentans TaxID=2576756 RepID=A0A6N8I442_9FIRM|nr:hypothetical protein [Caproicibacter fermentans]MVB12715.1 hypothetical protein [Caproicibacter fermentans]OCN02212.1 hypothetical protein A7X67_15645 [Clostridium sp. W14A]QNK39262.1 hypothetical protein HCR03_10840 [Caproicibacter fermentans]